ncbi:acetate--CoA ligase family protein [Marivita sp. S6314]|uniref:acetate--CoA ligase family protein n=1 Tax=Marivita sp. S6314 TaxID=2926406 RepID=UPI001FF4DBDD|nr:acetate--CoA ligase family protein [Marivita sp. S6314]MCK0151187.1 acetate--CoA ligase family protein [Marivita sp. S6314]
MTRTALERLFTPHSIAVIGGGAWCRSVLGALSHGGFAGPVWHVHPTADGALRDIASLPQAPDACFIGVNRDATVDVVDQLSAIGAGGAVCFASGFAETEDGKAHSDGLITAAREMAIVGPNCYGFVNALDGVAVWPDVHGLIPVDSGVAVLTQSSNIALNLSMQQRGLPIGFLGTAGNQAQIGVADMALHLLQDPQITALGLYLEGVGNVHRMQAVACAAQRLGKPIIALKSGRSEAAQSAALSHTASMAGSDAGAGALFARLGIVRVRSLDAMIEALKHAHLYGPATPGPIASLSCSGGEASLMADGGDARGLAYAPLTDDQDSALNAVLGPLVTRSNPLDYQTFIWNDAARMGEVYSIMAAGPAELTAIVVDYPREDRCVTSAWACVEDAAVTARRASGKPVALLASLPESLSETRAQRLMAAGVLPLNGLEAGLDALAALYAPQVTPDPDRDIPMPVALEGPRVLDEAAAKTALAEHGADVPRHVIASSVEDAVSGCASLLPVALKACGLAHKSEHGGVVLDLPTQSHVEDAARRMGCDRFLLEEMISDGIAELLVSVVADEAHGYVLTLGAGGVWTELWQDTLHLLMPATGTEIDAALKRLRIAPLLEGYRGKPAANRAAVVAAIMAIQDYVTAQSGRVAEVEVNPLIVTPTRAVVADALIRGDL